jgi:hypothetical protein
MGAFTKKMLLYSSGYVDKVVCRSYSCRALLTTRKCTVFSVSRCTEIKHRTEDIPNHQLLEWSSGDQKTYMLS